MQKSSSRAAISSSPPTHHDFIASVGEAAAAAELQLIGGQAVNVWADLLGASGFAASEDIDFMGAKHQARAFAELAGGTCKSTGTPPMSEVRIPRGRQSFAVDILTSVFGLKKARFINVRFEKMELSVLHPVDCMYSKAANLRGLGRAGSPQARWQFELAVECAGLFLAKPLFANKRRALLNLYQEIFKFCLSPNGRAAWRATDCDPFSVIDPHHPDIPDEFCNIRYPQMRVELASKRPTMPPARTNE